MESPATATVSSTTGPPACVPVLESPYLRFTLAPVEVPDEEVYGWDVDFLHDFVLQASDMIHRSLEPVSVWSQNEQGGASVKHTEVHSRVGASRLHRYSVEAICSVGKRFEACTKLETHRSARSPIPTEPASEASSLACRPLGILLLSKGS